MTHVHTFAVGLLCLALPSIGAAVELQLNSRASFSYDTGRNSSGERQSIVLSAPITLVPTKSGRYDGRLFYVPTLEIRPTDRNVTNWNHQIRGTGGYQLSPRARLDGTINFSFASTGFFDTETPVDDPSTPADQATNGHNRTLTSLSYSYLLTPRFHFLVSVQHNLAQFNDPSRTDSQTVGGSTSVNYRFSARNSFGGGAESFYSIFEPTFVDGRVVAGQNVTNVRLFVNWVHHFTKNLTARINVGPTLNFFEDSSTVDVPRYPSVLVTRDDVTILGRGFLNIDAECAAGDTFPACFSGSTSNVDEFDPRLANVGVDTFDELGLTPDQALVVPRSLEPPDADTRRQVNYFGRVSLKYQLPRWNFNVSFRRSQSTQAGFGTSTALSSGSFSINYRASERWRLSLSGLVSKRDSLTTPKQYDVLIQDSVENGVSIDDLDSEPIAEFFKLVVPINAPPPRTTEQLTVNANFSIRRQMTKRLSLVAGAIYSYTDRAADRNTSPGSRFRVSCGASYSFKPVRF